MNGLRGIRPGWLMSSACAGMFAFGIVMAVLGAILPALFSRISFDKGEAGALFLVMNLAMLGMSLLFGPVVDRFGFRLFLAFSAVAVAASFVLFARASSYGVLVAAAAVLGFGGGGLNGGTNALAADLYPERRTSALSRLGIFFGFGALAVPFLIGTLLERLGLGTILAVAAGLALVPAALYAVLEFPRAKQAQGFPIARAAEVIRDPTLWLLGLLLFFQSGNEFTVGGWLSTHLHESFGLAASTSALVLAGYWAAIMAGRLATARLAGRVADRTLILAGATLSLLATALLAAAPSGTAAAVAAAAVGFGFAAIYPATLAVAGGLFPTLTGTAFSLIFAIALAGGMLCPWLAGRIALARGVRGALFIPVVNCAMIIVLQRVLALKSGRAGRTPAGA